MENGFLRLEPSYNKIGGKGMIKVNGKHLSLNSPNNVYPSMWHTLP